MSWRHFAHRVLSRTLRRIYRALPLFGVLPGAVAIIREGASFVVIERSDGLGLSFPGGMQWPWESAEQTVRREAREETGLTLEEVEFLFTYEDNSILPSRISVFRAQATGTTEGSWEGSVVRASLQELRAQITSPEVPIVDYLLRK